MKIINPRQDAESQAFAKKAADTFRDKPELFTYADGDPVAGELFAIRWNPFTVLVIRLHGDFEPECHSVYNLGHKADFPKLSPHW